MLICLGSTLFTMFSMEIGKDGSPDRIAERHSGRYWFCWRRRNFYGWNRHQRRYHRSHHLGNGRAGMGVGAGHQYAALMGCIILVGILQAFTVIEAWMDRINCSHTYKITCAYHEKIFEQYEVLMKQHNLKFIRGPQSRDHQTVSATWEAEGSKKASRCFYSAGACRSERGEV